MIKRSGVLVLTFLYLVTVSGFAINLHYCFSHICSVNINAPAKSCNKQLAGEMKCCQEKHFEVKVKDAHQLGTATLLSKSFNTSLHVKPYSAIFLQVKARSSDNVYKDLPDPPLSDIPSFLRNRNLLI
jgi:hypothetical protein